jgi:hypothetical protein
METMKSYGEGSIRRLPYLKEEEEEEEEEEVMMPPDSSVGNRNCQLRWDSMTRDEIHQIWT